MRMIYMKTFVVRLIPEKGNYEIDGVECGVFGASRILTDTYYEKGSGVFISEESCSFVKRQNSPSMVVSFINAPLRDETFIEDLQRRVNLVRAALGHEEVKIESVPQTITPQTITITPGVDVVYINGKDYTPWNATKLIMGCIEVSGWGIFTEGTTTSVSYSDGNTYIVDFGCKLTKDNFMTELPKRIKKALCITDRPQLHVIMKECECNLDRGVMNRLINNLNENINDMHKHYLSIVNELTTVTTINEVMSIKRKLLLAMVENLPLSNIHCYYCMINEGICHDCKYKNKHGGIRCMIQNDGDEHSSYGKVQIAKRELVKVIGKEYWKGE
jgi:hypothetical protein